VTAFGNQIAAVRSDRWRRGLLVGVVIAGLLLTDRWLKLLSIDYLRESRPIDLAWGFIRLVYQENHGAMLSLGAGLPTSIRFLFFTVLVALLLGVLLFAILLKRTVRPSDALAAAFVVGGGAGNVIDRLVYHGAVIDYVTIGFEWLRTGVFNLADAAIIVGALVFLLGRRESGR
jgi:signal peptidase II